MLLLISRRDYWQYRNNNIYNDCQSIEYSIGVTHSHWMAATGSILHIVKLLQFHCAIEKRHYVVWWIIFITYTTLRCHCIKIDSGNSQQPSAKYHHKLMFAIQVNDINWTKIEFRNILREKIKMRKIKTKCNCCELMAQLASTHRQSALSQSHLILWFLELHFFFIRFDNIIR